PRAQKDAEREPAEEKNDGVRRRRLRQRREALERAEKDGEEAGLEQLHLPAEAPERLPDAVDRQVEDPQQRHHGGVGATEQHGEREPGSEPADGEQKAVARGDEEQRRRGEEDALPRFAQLAQVQVRGEQPVLAD